MQHGTMTVNAVQISRLISDKYSLIILSACSKKELSAYEVRSVCNIPICGCYRRLRQLEEMGMVTRHQYGSKKISSKYKSNIRKIQIKISDGRLVSRVKHVDGKMVDYDMDLSALLD